MKKLIELEGEGYEKLLGEQILVFCMRYIYTGKLVAIDKDKILLEKPYIVYETGDFSNKNFSDAQSVYSEEMFVSLNAIECLFKTDKKA